MTGGVSTPLVNGKILEILFSNFFKSPPPRRRSKVLRTYKLGFWEVIQVFQLSMSSQYEVIVVDLRTLTPRPTVIVVGRGNRP